VDEARSKNVSHHRIALLPCVMTCHVVLPCHSLSRVTARCLPTACSDVSLYIVLSQYILMCHTVLTCYSVSRNVTSCWIATVCHAMSHWDGLLEYVIYRTQLASRNMSYVTLKWLPTMCHMSHWLGFLQYVMSHSVGFLRYVTICQTELARHKSVTYLHWPRGKHSHRHTGKDRQSERKAMDSLERFLPLLVW